MTNMSSPFVRKAKLTVPLPSDYVRCMLKKVGMAKRSFGYWPHELQVGRGRENKGVIKAVVVCLGWLPCLLASQG